MDEDNLKLYSITSAAKKMCVGKDYIYQLINNGEIGFITQNSRKKIPHNEIVRFQKANTTYTVANKIKSKPVLSNCAVNKIFKINKAKEKSLNGKEILNNIIKGN